MAGKPRSERAAKPGAVRSAAAPERPASYAVGAVVRATGISEHTLRAWERRYGVVRPDRSAGGTRRYSEAQLRHLLLLKRAVDAGHRIGSLADLSAGAIERLLAEARPDAEGPIDQVLEAVERFDGERAEELMARQFAALGPRLFGLEVALPLLRRVGEQWERGRLSIAAEHMVSGITRSLLGTALRTTTPGADAPTMVCGTPSGERHEFGLLVGALLAVGAGVRVVYLGPDLPAEEIAGAARISRARVVLLAALVLHRSETGRFVLDLSARLPKRAQVWLGGSAGAIPRNLDVHILSDIDDLDSELRTNRDLKKI